MKPSLYIVTAFLLCLSVSLASFDIPEGLNTKEVCGAFMKPTGHIKITSRLVYVECKHKTGLVELVTVSRL